MDNATRAYRELAGTKGETPDQHQRALLLRDAGPRNDLCAGLKWDTPVHGNWFLTASLGGSINNADRCDNNEGLDQWGIRLDYGF